MRAFPFYFYCFSTGWYVETHCNPRRGVWICVRRPAPWYGGL